MRKIQISLITIFTMSFSSHLFAANKSYQFLLQNGSTEYPNKIVTFMLSGKHNKTIKTIPLQFAGPGHYEEKQFISVDNLPFAKNIEQTEYQLIAYLSQPIVDGNNKENQKASLGNLHYSKKAYCTKPFILNKEGGTVPAFFTIGRFTHENCWQP